MGEKISNDMTDKIFVCKIYKQFTQMFKQIKKSAEVLNGYFSKRDITDGQQLHEKLHIAIHAYKKCK